MKDLLGNADDEHGVFDTDSENSISNSNKHSTTSNKTELNITDHNEAIITVEGANSECLNQVSNPSGPPPYIVNPHQWDDYGFYTPEPSEPFMNQNSYEITWEPNLNLSTKIPNPSHYLYSFLPDYLENFEPMELYPPAKPDPSAASSSTAHIWPTIDDYRAWMLSEPNTKRRKLFKYLAVNHPIVLVDIYQAETSAPQDSPPLRPDTVPMDIWASLGYEEQSDAYQEEIKDEHSISYCKGKGIMKNY